MIDLRNRLEPYLGEIGSICTKTGLNDEDRTVDDCISRKMAIDMFLVKLTERERKSFRHMWTTVEVKYFTAKILEQLPSAHPTYTDEEIQRMQDLESAEIEKAYQLGYEEGKKDAQPERKKGKWIEKEYSPFYCSVCGTYQYSASWEIKNKEYNFCPRCGADMRGEIDE